MKEKGENDSPPARSAASHWSFGHDVRFYNGDAYLCSAVSDYLAAGIRAGQPIVVIATAEHRRAFAERLRQMGLDPDELDPSDSVWVDARETLNAFMVGSMPDAERLTAAFSGLMDRVLANRQHLTVRAYGEGVDLLWREGKCEAAIAVENLWNDIARRYAVSMLCTYSRDSLMAHAPMGGIERICGVHDRVL